MTTALRESTVPAPPLPRQNQRCDAVVEAYRVARGIKEPETARQHLLRLPSECAQAIEAFRRHATPERCERFIAPIRFALSAPASAPILTDDLELKAERDDQVEDLREKAYDLHPCRETAIARVRAIDADMAEAGQIRAALVAKWALQL